jgi:hypothetical protein
MMYLTALFVVVRILNWKNMKKTKIGIDYSMTSPAICIGDSTYSGCKIRYLTSIKKFAKSYLDDKIVGTYFGTWPSDEFRFDYISNWILTQIPSDSDVILEGYAFAGKGKVFHIGENTGLLKHKLYKANIQFYTPTPTQIKKQATGMGNASKTDMYLAFVDLTGIKLAEELGCTPESNPLSDCIDSFFIHRYCKKKKS